MLNLETYQAAISGQPLDLTYMEYELLKFLSSHPGKVFTRETLLSRVWGYEYYGGARTVDVHMRRLRAKLGEEHANLIQTVRSVGYRFGQSRWSSVDANEASTRVPERYADAASNRGRDSDELDVLRLLALRTRRHLELDSLALFEGAIAGRLDRAVVHEDVGAALTGDEAVALLGVEPFDGTGSQSDPLS